MSSHLAVRAFRPEDAQLERVTGVESRREEGEVVALCGPWWLDGERLEGEQS